MKIVIDARLLRYTGIGRYVRALIDLIPSTDLDNHYIVLLRREDYATWQPPSDNVEKILVDVKPYSFAEQIIVPWRLFRLHPDLVHFPHFYAPLLYLRNHVVTIHDLTLRDFPTRRGNGIVQRILFAGRYWAMRFSLRRSVLHAAAVFTPTEYVRQRIIESWPVIARNQAKFVATPEAVSGELSKPAPLDRLHLHPHFLLFVGNFYPSKNIGRLIESMPILLEKRPELQLVLVGRENYFSDHLKQQIEKLGIRDSVLFAGFVSDGELASLYRKAKLFVFPSLSEGFGLPPLEAMAAGAPVISSNASCMPEVLGDAAAYFDPNDPADMAIKIDELLNDDKKRDQLRKAGLEHVKQFSWERMAGQTLTAYKSVLK